MDKKEYEVKSTLIKRITVHHRVFAESKVEAIALVMWDRGERVGHDEKVVEKLSHTARQRKEK